MIDYFVLIIAFVNILLSFLTLSKEIFTKIKEIKNISDISKQLNSNILSIEKDIKDINIKDFYSSLFNKELNSSYKITEKDKNLFNIYFVMKFSSDYFSKIYKDNDLLCNIRIKQGNCFKTIIQYYSNNKSKNIDQQPQKVYYTNQNSDLITISKNKYNFFIINNISDYKKNNHFVLQTSYMEEHCKALISIPIYLGEDMNKKKDNFNDLIACYTIYFSKPLNEKVEITNSGNSFITLINKLNELIKEYVQFNKEEPLMYNDEIITNEKFLLESK